MTVFLFTLFTLLFASFCNAQFQFVQLFDTDTPLNTTIESVDVLVRTGGSATALDFTNSTARQLLGAQLLSSERLTFTSVVYRIDAKALAADAMRSHGWRLSATLTLEHAGRIGNTIGDGFSVAYGDIPPAGQYFDAQSGVDNYVDCGLPSNSSRANIAICHMVYDMGIRPLGIHVLLNRSVPLVTASLGAVITSPSRRIATVLFEQRPNSTNVASLGLMRNLVGNFTDSIPLTGWMFGARTGSSTLLVRVEHVVLSVIADSCVPAQVGCAANSIVLPFASGVVVCATLNNTLPSAGENHTARITYEGDASWSQHNGDSIVRYVSMDEQRRIYAIEVENAASGFRWLLNRTGLCTFEIVQIKANSVVTEVLTAGLAIGSIPTFGIVDSRTTAKLRLPSVIAPLTSSSNGVSVSVSMSTSQTSTTSANATVTLPGSLAAPSANGPLIGGIVGGIVGLLIIGSLMFYCVSRKRAREPSPSGLQSPAPTSDHPNPKTTAIYTTLSSAPMSAPIVYDQGVDMPRASDAIYESGNVSLH